MRHTLLCVLGFLSLLYCGHAQYAVLTIEPNWSTFFIGEFVTFTCDTKEEKDNNWYYRITRNDQEFIPYTRDKNYTLHLNDKRYSGEYQCRVNIRVSIQGSNKVSLNVSDKDVILETPASTLFEGESVTLRCRHRDQSNEKNAAFYKDGSPIEMDTNHQSPMSKNTVQLPSDGSSYTCKFEDEESEPIILKMEPQPKAQLSVGAQVGSNVTLTCSVTSSSSSSSSSGWKYFWYRGKKTSEPLTTQDVDLLSNGRIRVPRGGVYCCRGGRGNPVYYTDYSQSVATNRAVVTLRPNWPEIYYGETITLACEIQDGGDAEWEYEWMTPSSYRPQQPTDSMIRSSHRGDYRCIGKMKSDKSSTAWSDAFTLTISSNKPRPVLTVSPLWLSPGDSVTLNCGVEHPSAGWRFYWYKAVPNLSNNDYDYELLPESINGTEQDSFIVHGQTHSTGYVCRAGRGHPVYYTIYNNPEFVWSGDFHSAASLTVSPDRAQHFNNELLSLSCEGNSTEWRVSRFESSSLTRCNLWGTMSGSTCNINRYWHSGVYWCESGTGHFSNAVNITIQYSDIILVSPVHPVAEGRSVTLSCKLKTEKVLYDVKFYKNGELIHNHTGEDLTISAVSKSDEGFYKCEGGDSPQGRWIRASPESWMSVKSASRPEPNSPFPVLLVVGLVCGALLIILLLLFLYRCRKSKDSHFIRSQSTNQGPATDHMINQVETQNIEYASVVHDDTVLYERVKGSAELENDESAYSEVDLKNFAKNGKPNDPEESAVYSRVTMASAADDNLMYAQVQSHSKAEKDKGKSSRAAADETVYSEVKPGTARGNNAA